MSNKTLCLTSYNLGYTNQTDKAMRSLPIIYYEDFNQFISKLTDSLQTAPDIPKMDVAGLSYTSDGTEINVTNPEEYKIFRESIVNTRKPVVQGNIKDYLKLTIKLAGEKPKDVKRAVSAARGGRSTSRVQARPPSENSENSNANVADIHSQSGRRSISAAKVRMRAGSPSTRTNAAAPAAPLGTRPDTNRRSSSAVNMRGGVRGSIAPSIVAASAPVVEKKEKKTAMDQIKGLIFGKKEKKTDKVEAPTPVPAAAPLPPVPKLAPALACADSTHTKTVPENKKDQKKKEKEAKKEAEKLKALEAIQDTWADVVPDDDDLVEDEPAKLSTFNNTLSKSDDENEDDDDDDDDNENEKDKEEETEAANSAGKSKSSLNDDLNRESRTSSEDNSSAPSSAADTAADDIVVATPQKEATFADASSPTPVPTSERKISASTVKRLATPKKLRGASVAGGMGLEIAPDTTPITVTKTWEQTLRKDPLPDAARNKGIKKKGSGGGGGSHKDEDSLSPLGNFKTKSKKGKDAEGRPSIGTITEQWEFMVAQFGDNDMNQIEWLMVSKKPGAYKYAHKKQCQAEDKYFKSLHDIEENEVKMTHLVGANAKIIKMVADIGALHSDITNTKGDALVPIRAQLNSLRQTLTAYVNNNASGSTSNPLDAFSESTAASIRSIIVFKEGQTEGSNLEDGRVTREARKVTDNMTQEIEDVKKKLQQARKLSDISLTDMELWSKREVETDDYAAVMREEELEWMEKEFEANQQALRTMREYIPVDIAQLSVNDLMEAAKSRWNPGMYTLELANELKNNRLLQWVVVHTDDIAMANFLSGDKKSYFENLEGLDVIELRALTQVLPVKFELDGDGKKAAWRARFMNRAKQVVSQQNRDKVKGVWDGTLGKRQMVELQPLKPELLKRPIYFYRTKEQSEAKLKQFDDKLANLEKKKKMLAEATTEAADAKTEYDTILKEMRDPDMMEQYGEQLSKVKDEAKKMSENASRKLKMLTTDVNRLQKSVDDAPLTRDAFKLLEDDIEFFITQGEEAPFPQWNEPGQAPVMITGPFESEPEIVKVQRQAAKAMSAEEEAEARKKELSAMFSGTADSDITAVSADGAGAAGAGALGDTLNSTGGLGSTLGSTVSVAAAAATEGTDQFHDSMSSMKNYMASAKVDCSAFDGSGNNKDSNGGCAFAAKAGFSFPAGEMPVSSSATDGNTGDVPSSAKKTPGRRHSVLDRNPQLLSTLEKMFSPDGKGGAGGASSSIKTPSNANRRGSMGCLSGVKKPLFKGEDGDETEGPKEKKESKSKLLQRMLAPQPEGAEAAAAPRPPNPFARPNPFGGGAPGGGMSFLDQIKNARKPKGETVVESVGAAAGAGAAADTSAAPPAPPSTTDESAAAAPVLKRPAMSMFDAIKARRID